VLELIVLTEWFEAETTGEDPATMIPNTSFAFYAICLTQYARARMLRQALSAVTDPSLTKITNGSHHGHSSGIGTCMFDHAVALSHALLFPTLGAHWQSLDAPTEVAEGSVLLPPFALVALHCEVARPVNVKYMMYNNFSLSHLSFSPSVTAVHGTAVPFSYVEMILPLPPQTYFFLSGFHFVVLFPLTSLLFRHL